MEGFEIGVEFRNRGWLVDNQREETLRMLRENRITYIVSDEPQVKDNRTVPYVVDCTTDTAYFRFHGKNVENWLKKDIQTFERYDYLRIGHQSDIEEGTKGLCYVQQPSRLTGNPKRTDIEEDIIGLIFPLYLTHFKNDV